MPPGNFPSGCPPIVAQSIEDAVKEARKRTKKGIWVIALNHWVQDEFKIQHEEFKILDEINEKWTSYDEASSVDKDPYQLLLDGYILVTERAQVVGFEWPTVIIFGYNGRDLLTHHLCNFMMRCTTNLVVVKPGV